MPPTLSLFSCLRTLSRLSGSARRLQLTPLSSRMPPAFATPRLPQTPFRRYSEAGTRPLTDRTNSSSVPQPPKQRRPEYELTFTCKPCSTRSSHRISKQGYHHGSVLITCPECKNKHVISDHLNIFGDKNLTIEDLMREQGQLVKKGTLSEDGDLEFWVDGTTTKRNKQPGTGEAVAEEGETKGIA